MQTPAATLRHDPAAGHPLVDTRDGLSPGWLTAVLRASGRIRAASVTGVALAPVGNGMLGLNLRLTLSYDRAEPGAPATLVASFVTAVEGSPVRIGGQDCHPAPSGAHTGDLSAEMLADAGASAVIVGHSERRADHGETDALVRQKAEAAWRAGLIAIVCVGETQDQRDAGQALAVVGRMLNRAPA